ncbi:hypothetical protein [Actinoplanes solisilvae]|uniref:hypothetical protein n=1 Tax=Actinoplanes solisilvae TaxID=2486853 RepID=UPI000FD82F79|nr:hypothetical protein [Actinoplanes solisilvae]
MYRKALLALLVLVGVVLGPPVPAQAHPFGDPQTVAIDADPARPHVVRVKWKVGGLDDLTLLGVKIGVLPEDRVFLDGAVFYQDSDEAAIAPSGQFADYLLRQIVVTGGGEKCAGTVEPPTELAKRGATVDFTCPAAVGKVDVAVRTLLDLHPAYRTLATGPGGQRAVYQADTATHEWKLSNAESKSHKWPLGITAAAALAALAALLFWRRRNRSKQSKHLS